MDIQQTTTRQSPSRPRGRRHTFNRGDEQRQYDHEVLDIARVVRVVRGGRRFRFRASVVVGDRSGTVGFGIGKSKDIQQAIQKAQDQAAKNVVKVQLAEGTITHTVEAKFKGAYVMLKPARPGTGVIAGGTVRIVADLAGINDLVSKIYGSSNRLSNARATLKALNKLKSVRK
jgi:small subunit ribosomal protein S5